MKAKHYGEIVNKIRQDRNMTLKEAAGDSITPNNLSRFEKGLASVKVDTFFEILSRFHLDGEDYVEVLHIHDDESQRSALIIDALRKNDIIKARQILGKKSEWSNIIDYYVLKLGILEATEFVELTPDEVEAVDYLLNYISSIDTLYIFDFVVIELLLTLKIQCFELKFLEYLEKIIIKGLEDSKYKTEHFCRRYAITARMLVRTYSRYRYYDKAEKLIYKLKIIISEEFPREYSAYHLFYLNIFEVYNLLRQNNPKGIERANTLLHYMDAQNNLFALAWIFQLKNTFVQEVQRLNKTGIPFPTKDE